MRFGDVGASFKKEDARLTDIDASGGWALDSKSGVPGTEPRHEGNEEGLAVPERDDEARVHDDRFCANAD